ncbi:MAG: helix-turn-helix transcriptional regulator [Clostridia bacterium]|nr:helix-turn-helix transcriptional regulator [Clostridia bacterium]
MERPIYRSNYRFLRFTRHGTHYTDARSIVHPHYFGYMRRGRVRLVCDSRTVEVEEGELFYIPVDCHYQSFWSGEPEICFDSLGFDHFLQGEERYPLQKIAMSPAVKERFFALTDHDMTVNYETLGRFFLFLSAVLLHMETRSVSRARQTVDRALTYMESAERFSAAALARHCRVSESGLFAAFRAEEGCTPLAAWHKKQATRAELLLRTTDLPIEEIADRLGYCSATYFRSVLRRETGRSPREIRRDGTI